MQTTSVKLSPFDLMTALLNGKVSFDTSNTSDTNITLAVFMENRVHLMILTTSVAVLIGCVVVLVWRRSSSAAKKAAESPVIVVPKKVTEDEVDDGRKKVTVFFGTQTGTAEGFAKVLMRMRIGDKRSSVIDKRAARGVENVDPVKKLDVERVKLPKSISVRSNGYMKGAQAGDGSVSRARAVDRIKTAFDSQKVFVRGKKEEEQLELKVYNQGMTKTELCNKWQQTGACPYGDHCQFAHGIEELRPVIRHPRYKTEVCRMVLAGDPCPYGHRCHFRHALTEEEKLMSRRINCNMFM